MRERTDEGLEERERCEERRGESGGGGEYSFGSVTVFSFVLGGSPLVRRKQQEDERRRNTVKAHTHTIAAVSSFSPQAAAAVPMRSWFGTCFLSVCVVSLRAACSFRLSVCLQCVFRVLHTSPVAVSCACALTVLAVTASTHFHPAPHPSPRLGPQHPLHPRTTEHHGWQRNTTEPNGTALCGNGTQRNSTAP